MSDSWELQVYDEKQLVYTVELVGPAVLGRQRTETEKLYSRGCVDGRERVVVAANDEKAISRDHVLVEPQAEGGFRITNKSERRRIGMPDNQVLEAQASCLVAGDVLLLLGRKAVRLRSLSSEETSLQGLPEPTLPPGQPAPAASSFSFLSQPSGASGLDLKETLAWLHASMDVLQSAASHADFFARAAQAVVQLMNLDSGCILLWEQDEWRPQALVVAPRLRLNSGRPFSRSILNRVRREGRTFWQVPGAVLADVESVQDVEAAVAAPILDRHGKFLGALYGERRSRLGAAQAEPISELEALFVEVLARGVAAGLGRLEQEKAALASQVQFEQFFTPELARQLALQPQLLQGRDTQVSILFCDIRGFSRICERLGPARTLEWMGAVLGALSECVRAQGGVLVNYIGDELLAMWGAPEEQPEHARLACRAALDMLAQLPRLNAAWQTTLQEPMDLGIGINTGLARVGNTGSHIKFQYGPLGNTVNLASRVQGATKHVKGRLLITGATQAQIGDDFATRRLCQIQVVNITEPVTLYELVPAGQPSWSEARRVYEHALAEFEATNFAVAAWALGNWRAQHPGDEPALLLLYRAVRSMVEGPAPGHPVWVLPGK